MVVNIDFKCIWSPEKIERISQLIIERVLLLVGTRIFEKIKCISFYDEKVADNILYKDKSMLPYVFISSDMYELTLKSSILLSMLIPGAGQSQFDNLIIKLRNFV